MPMRSRPFILRICASPAGLALAWGLAGSPCAQAQSLPELYQAAHAYDASYLAARANLAAAQFRYDQARGLRMPQVGLALDGARQLSSTPAATTQLANTTTAVATLNATQSLYNRTNDVAVAQAEKTVDAYRFDLDAAEQDLILRVAQAYFDVLSAQDALTTAQASLTTISEQLASAKRGFQLGTETVTDSREAQARYDLARFTHIQAQNDLAAKRILLDQTVGRTDVVPWPIALPIALPPSLSTDVDEWIARADAEHPMIRKARIALDLARLDTDKARAGHLPTVALNGSYARGKSDAAGLASLGDPSFPGTFAIAYSTPTTVKQIGISINVPLFSGFQVQNRIKETLALADKSQDDLDSVRRSVAQSTRTAYLGVRSVAAQVDALDAAAASSRLAADATRLGFKVGVRVNIDVLNAQSQLYTTEAQLAKARYDLIMGSLRLLQAAGRLSVDDVQSLARSHVPPALPPAAAPMSGFDASPTPLPAEPPASAASSALPSSPATRSNEASFTTPPSSIVLARLQDWAGAWMARDADRYLSFYGPQFQPAKRSRTAWEADRRRLFDKRGAIDVNLTHIQARQTGPGRVETEFDQTYTSADYHDVVHKLLIWDRTGPAWVIVEERSR